MPESKVIERARCPSCASRGNDKHGDNLAVYDDGHSYCFSCGFYDIGAMRTEDVARLPRYTIPCTWLLDKNIDTDTCEAWEVRVKGKLSRRDGLVYDTGIIVFPFYSIVSEITAVKTRDRRAEIEDKMPKKETISYDGEPEVFGLHMLSRKDTLILVEGETDALRTWRAVNEFADVLGIPGSRQFKLLRNHVILMRRYRRIVTLFDEDSAGRMLRDDAHTIIPTYLLYQARYGKYKDACEIIDDEEIVQIVRSAKGVPNSRLVTGSNLKSRYRESASQYEGLEHFSTGLEVVDEMLGGGMYAGDFIGLLGNTGVGKSTLCASITYECITQTQRNVLLVGTEMKMKHITDTLLKMHLQVPSLRRVSDDELEDALDFIGERTIIYDSDSTWDDLYDSIIHALYAYNVSIIVIDVLQDIEGFTEWQKGHDIMQSLTRIALGDIDERRPACVVLVVLHTKAGERGFTKKLSQSSIAGGKAVGQKLTAIIGIEDDEEKEELSPERRIRLVKQCRFRTSALKLGTVLLERGRYVDVAQSARSERRERVNGVAVPTRRRRTRRGD